MKVVICGAGIAGLALAQRLNALGWDVVVLEKAPGPRTQGYMMDFFGPGYDAAEAMDVLPRLRELGYQVDEVSYLDEAGRQRAGLNFARFARTMQGRLLSIMRPDLERALREGLSADVDLRFATSLTHIDANTDGVRVTLADGTTLDADLLVGADGIRSTVRSLVFGEEHRHVRYLGFHTAAFTFDDPQIHAELRGRVAAFAVHRTPDAALPADIEATLRREYGSLGWIVPRALAHCPPAAEVYYDQVAQIDLPRWSSGRVTLVGDACQAVSLLAGQGASLAIAGAYVLAEQLARTDSIETGLDRYEQLWRTVVVEKQQAARNAARWFLPTSQRQLLVRRIAMKLARLPGFDRYVAATLTGKPTAIVQELRRDRRTSTVQMTGGADDRQAGSAAPGGRAITENSTPKGSVTVANRPYTMSSGSPDVPPAAVARRTTASVSATSKVVPQAEPDASGASKIPATSWPSGLRRKVKSKSGRSSLRSSVKSNTDA